MLRRVDCVFCGAAMADGWVAVQGTIPLQGWDSQLTWEDAEARAAARGWRGRFRRRTGTLMVGGLVRRRERGAHLCYDCGAVVIEPGGPW